MELRKIGVKTGRPRKIGMRSKTFHDAEETTARVKEDKPGEGESHIRPKRPADAVTFNRTPDLFKP